MHNTVDYLVIGSGIAGLTFAVKTAEKLPDANIMVITKADEDESNTKYAQGGVAAVTNFTEDSFQKHINDTLDAGDGLCNEAVVKTVVEEGPLRVRELIDWGAEFDKNDAGEYDLGKEGGHTANRVLHHKDVTGQEIERALLARIHELPNVEFVTHHFVIDLITQHHLGHSVTRVTPDITCYGVYVLNTVTQRIEAVPAKTTLLASGGVGQVYKSTTNPTIATGDGMAMFYRAKGRIANMEFIQFHPTSLYNPAESPSFLISEAVRGAGAVLRTIDGRKFMHKYDDRESLAPRDIVARAIDNEIKQSGEEYVYLDCRHLNQDELRDHFPNIYQKCAGMGLDLATDMIPVIPAAHYACGGILVDMKGRTSIRHLYACGECSATGLHGANRLASNSLLEALVYAHRIHEDAMEANSNRKPLPQLPEWSAEGTTDPNEMVLITQSRKELREIMSNYVGIVRSDVRLKRAMERMWLLYNETEELYNTTTLSPQLCELRNMITVGYLITRSSSIRRESRGLHFNTDYPDKKPFAEDTLL